MLTSQLPSPAAVLRLHPIEYPSRSLVRVEVAVGCPFSSDNVVVSSGAVNASAYVEAPWMKVPRCEC